MVKVFNWSTRAVGAKNQFAVERSFAFAGCRNTTVLRGESHY
jgi:hypothetical protein